VDKGNALLLLLVVIVLFVCVSVGSEGKSLGVYFPKAKWYDWDTHEAITNSGGEYQTVDTPINHIPVSLQ